MAEREYKDSEALESRDVETPDAGDALRRVLNDPEAMERVMDRATEAQREQVAMDAMQQHIEELTEERDSLSSKLEKCEAERAKYERWFYEKFGQAFEAEEDLDALLEANRGLQAKLDRYRTALKAVVDACDLPDADYTAVERAALRKAREALSDEW